MISVDNSIMYIPASSSLNVSVRADDYDNLILDIRDQYMNQLSKEVVSFKDKVIIDKLKEMGWTPPEDKQDSSVLENELLETSRKLVFLEKENERLKNQILKLVDIIFSEE